MTSATRSHDNVLLEVLGTQSDTQDAQNQVPALTIVAGSQPEPFV
jgi:hypothetical protein